MKIRKFLWGVSPFPLILGGGFITLSGIVALQALGGILIMLGLAMAFIQDTSERAIQENAWRKAREGVYGDQQIEKLAEKLADAVIHKLEERRKPPLRRPFE